MMFLNAHPLQIFLQVYWQLWPAQAGSELGLIYRLWLAQKTAQPSGLQLLSWAVGITRYGFCRKIRIC